MHRVPPAAVAALLLAVSPAVAADDADDAGADKPTAISARLDGATATAIVSTHYTIDVPGPDVDNEVTLSLPHHGVVTGVIAIADGAPHRLALTPSDHAEKLFQDLAALEGGRHRRWAIKVAQHSPTDATVSIQVAAPRATRMKLELELAVPTCFHDDVRYFAAPQNWAATAPSAVKPHRSVDQIDADCETDGTLGDHVWFAFPTRELVSHPFGEQRVGVHGQQLDLQQQHFARVELAVAGALSEVPRDLATVFVVDASRSVSGGQLATQQAVVASYLAHAPRSRVQVIAYARKPRALLAGWSIAAQAKSRIDRELGQLATANGSNLDAGIRAAGDWLARTQGTKRIVVFTDSLISNQLGELEPASLKQQLPDGTLVHVVALDTSGALQREDDVVFGRLAVATEGIGVRAGLDDNDKIDALELVRPIALDNAVLKTPGWDTISVDAFHACSTTDGDRLPEGTSCGWLGSSTTGVGMITLEAFQWNHRITRLVRADPTEGRTLARLLSVISHDFGAGVVEQIQRAALAVNPVWSLVGAWGGKDGYADITDGGFGISGSGCGCGGGGSSDSIGIGTIGTMGRRVDLRTQLEAGVARCRPGTAKVKIDVELTLDEIVGVEVVTDDPRVHDCVVEAVWNTDVVLATAQRHTFANVVFGG